MKAVIVAMIAAQAVWAIDAAMHVRAEWNYNAGRVVEAAAIYPWDYKYDLMLGAGNVLRGNLAQAARRLERVIARVPRHAAAWNNLGAARALAGDRAGAERALVKALTIDPTYRAARKNLAIVRGWAMGKYELVMVGS